MISNTGLEQYQPPARMLFDRILLDVPCSGLGTIDRHPDIRWTRQEDDLQRFSQRQLDLLGAAALLLKPQGVLVYATCSTEPEENEEVIARFLAGHTGFFLSNGGDFLPEAAKNLVDAAGFFRTDQQAAAEMDGFFAARLIKQD